MNMGAVLRDDSDLICSPCVSLDSYHDCMCDRARHLPSVPAKSAEPFALDHLPRARPSPASGEAVDDAPDGHDQRGVSEEADDAIQEADAPDDADDVP